MKREDVIRLKRAIESDRMSMTAEGLDVIVRDLQSVLSDYFYLAKPPKLTVKVKDGRYLVEITAFADAIKAFTKMP